MHTGQPSKAPTMTPLELIKTVYLGDRACKWITIDGWRQRVVVCVDDISRIRSKDGSWDFYTAEDIPDGCLVFADVVQIRFSPSGPVPNDLINEFVATGEYESGDGKSVCRFRLSISSVDSQAAHSEIAVEIDASDFYLQDPREPEVQIRG